MRITRDNCSGLIIDIQEKLYPVIAEKENLLANCIKLITGLQILNIPIAVTQQYTKGLGATVSEISSLFQPFTFFEKNSFSCMDEPAYAGYLTMKDSTNVLLCGIESHVCVLQTAIDLQELGYQPVVLSDCISSRNPEEKKVVLQRLALEGIRVSTVESILFELTRYATASEFKAISKIVK